MAADIRPDAVKTGMLSSSRIIQTVAGKIKEHGLAPLVVDPVMISKSGHALLAPEAVEALKAELIPLAALITPNLPGSGSAHWHADPQRRGDARGSCEDC